MSYARTSYVTCSVSPEEDRPPAGAGRRKLLCLQSQLLLVDVDRQKPLNNSGRCTVPTQHSCLHTEHPGRRVWVMELNMGNPTSALAVSNGKFVTQQDV
ncbi:hypothetical protein SKAU_G00392290 [Synaphobranchus kaupii]|uniref:Uncharacterized protein n=1 Tax=Synaphobranchus kaupii TaxID=118154 RepID=A0A9Q1EBS6_SYNKA|nr:hypothetical protein SKAU_G00392290 [Synaphobranchus kaupii]